MKKLYVQTCKRLPAYGCKIVPVKELVHGKTLKKVRILIVTIRKGSVMKF